MVDQVKISALCVLLYLFTFGLTSSIAIANDSNVKTICNWLSTQEIDVSDPYFKKTLSDRYNQVKISGRCKYDQKVPHQQPHIKIEVSRSSGGGGGSSEKVYSTNSHKLIINNDSASIITSRFYQRKTYYRNRLTSQETRSAGMSCTADDVKLEVTSNSIRLHSLTSNEASYWRKSKYWYKDEPPTEDYYETAFDRFLEIEFSLSDKMVTFTDLEEEDSNWSYRW